MRWLMIGLLSSPVFALQADINKDGIVDMLDLAILASEWMLEEDCMRLGPELVTNGGFGADTNWIKTNATIADGVATLTSSDGFAAITQNLSVTKENAYLVTFDINTFNVAGSGVIEVNFSIGGLITTIIGTGNHQIRKRAGRATEEISFAMSGYDDGSVIIIDNVSVKKILSDVDFATAFLLKRGAR